VTSFIYDTLKSDKFTLHYVVFVCYLLVVETRHIVLTQRQSRVNWRKKNWRRWLLRLVWMLLCTLYISHSCCSYCATCVTGHGHLSTWLWHCPWQCRVYNNWSHTTRPVGSCTLSLVSADSIWAVVVVWRKRVNIIRTAPCCVVYDTYAQWYAHKYEQFLDLYLVRVRGTETV